ncbi:DNA mismatch repair endonuclease MutL [Lactobacillus sp. CC-MHH1034]|uniref:DNA mismatch repair endonuclease MutL n=1 Tax=Agrilactobacillus fermenti TaxID=2586909 RepID=UPI001E2DAF83|nr:DNA mismatch repair endonuclease MutL [Agrilactobacillus fermenti]MCD2256758.1 DNA mismatch repair endonuclease MutL [Agrilactobacillus fermenti]
MPDIHELPEQLSNQIAAGEVVERPASVVKELVENAIDAGADQIDISVTDAGLSRIFISDNGGGIKKDQVELAFLPHTTSKISSRDDLFRVHSLGFRGEALASIAAVSRTTMLTATQPGLGTLIKLEGGKILSEITQTSRQGTSVEVRDLFFNTPARLKYVKSVNTELSHIADILNRLALANPAIAFTFSSNQNILLKTSGSGQLLRTITEIYSVGVGRQMLAIENHDLDFKITGFVSLPKLTRASRNYVSLFINGRYVKNYALNKAIIAGYGSKLMVGRYPLAILNLQMDPFLVDVNVHPTKQEVRLSKEDELGTLITQSIADKMRAQNLIPDAISNLQGQQQTHKQKSEQLAVDLDATSAAYLKPQGHAQTSANAPSAVQSAKADTIQEQPAQLAMQSDTQPVQSQNAASASSAYSVSTGVIFKEPQRLAAWDQRYQTETPPAIFDTSSTADSGTAAEDQLQTAGTPTEPRFPDLAYIGQIHGTYLIAESEDGFYLVDQHAAQERVNYEKYRQAIGEVSQDQQNLLVPIVLNYPSADYLAISNRLDLLAKVGIHLEPFGQNSFVVHTHPTWFKKGQEEETLKEMIDYVLADKHMTVAKFREKTAIMMSCKRAIKANHHLDTLQAKALLQHLRQAENPFNCPHGRPVLVHFTDKDMAKMFKRIQDAHTSFGL